MKRTKALGLSGEGLFIAGADFLYECFNGWKLSHERKTVLKTWTNLQTIWQRLKRAILQLSVQNGYDENVMDCFGSSFFRSVIGLAENSCQNLSQSNKNLKQIPTWLLAFSRASSRMPGFALNSHWLMMMLAFLLIGCFNYFDFGFALLSRNMLKSIN